MRKLLILLLLFTFFQGQSQLPTYGGKIKPEQANMDIRHYTIALNVDIPQKSISGYTVIDLILAQDTHTLLFDLMNDLQVEKVWVNGKETPFTHENNLITVNSSDMLPAGKTSVKVQY